MKKIKNKKPHDSESFGALALKALVSANVKLVLEARKKGDSLVVWRNGKVCHVPASEIELPKNPPKKAS